jgi:hypothetical protein
MMEDPLTSKGLESFLEEFDEVKERGQGQGSVQ